MKKVAILLFIIACVSTPCFLYAANETVQDEIQNMFNNIASAYDMKDVEGVASSALPDAILEYKDGTTMSVTDWKSQSARDFADTQMMRSIFMVESVNLQGDNAVTTYREIHDYTLASDPGHNYRSVGRWQADIQRASTGWKISHFKELSEDNTRDGTPLTSQANKPKF